MTSWANLKSIPLKKKETIRNYFFSEENDFAEASLTFLYAHIFTQRTAEPFYVYDKYGYFQPYLQTSQVVHYLRDEPTSGMNLAKEINTFAPVLNGLGLQTLKRNAITILQHNGQTNDKINDALQRYGVAKQVFDVGIVLDVSGSIPLVFSALRTLQKRTGNKTLKVFVMTESMDLLREFAMKGDPSWSYVSLLRVNAPQDISSRLLKTMCELKILQDVEYLIGKFSTPLGKLLYLRNQKITTESQFLSVDGSTWKALS
jgi:hypothetical protein